MNGFKTDFTSNTQKTNPRRKERSTSPQGASQPAIPGNRQDTLRGSSCVLASHPSRLRRSSTRPGPFPGSGGSAQARTLHRPRSSAGRWRRRTSRRSLRPMGGTRSGACVPATGASRRGEWSEERRGRRWRWRGWGDCLMERSIGVWRLYPRLERGN